MSRHASAARRGRSASPRLETLEPRMVCAVAIGLRNDTGGSRTDRITSDPTMVINRTLAVGQRLQYVVDNGRARTAILAGGRSFVPDGLNADGRHRICARVVGSNGRPERWSTTVVFTLDRNVAPMSVSLAIDTGVSATDGITSSSQLNVTGREQGALVQYSRDTGGWNATTAVWGSYQPQPGLNRLYARQVDVAGNASAPMAIAFNWDTTRDAAVRLEGPQSASFEATAGQEVSWVIECAAPMYVKAVNGTLPQVTFTFRGTTLMARYREGSGTNRLTYSHVFTAEEAGTGKLDAPVKACLCYGGMITDAAGNIMLKHALPSVTPPAAVG